jgi:preprotein translocase subunit SecD
MAGKNIFKLVTVLIISAVLIYLALFGASFGVYDIVPVQRSINLGLDLQGGVFVILEAKDTEQEEVTDETMNRAVATIRERVDQLGVAEPVIVREGAKRIRVELPGVNDPERAIELIGQTAQLQFIGPDGEVILTGADVQTARAVFGTDRVGVQAPQVQLEFKGEGTQAFAAATTKFVGQQISIVLDGKVISAPRVDEPIPTGRAVITGLPSIDRANDLAILIRAGALPVALQEIQTSSIGPTLGRDSLSRSLVAGQYGLILVLLFMIAYYRLPGIIADYALAVYVILLLIALSAINATLTLPGIAGLILSIGMAVDANVIIFERIKEELKNGKTLRAATESGFTRAIRTIIDANITTLIAAAVLFRFGTGPIRGFAVTLTLGILVSMFTAVVLTRSLLIWLVNTKIIKNPKLFGA